MVSKTTSPAINGAGKRKLTSWIESFVNHTSNLEAAPIFRKWAAISAIAAVLEQKVFVTTSSPLYPNLYIFLVGHAGIGKSRTLTAAMEFVRELPEIHFGATSMTMASLVDHMSEAKRTIVNLPEPMIEYNTLFIGADELSAFMNDYKGSSDLIAGLTTFYDVVPYSQARRTHDIRIKINRPQLNILTGTTPSNLVRFIPEFAWEQGFTSRILLIYSEERPMIDVFNTPNVAMPKDMIHDLKVINSIVGQFGWTEPYAKAMHNWKMLGFPPVPDHPKLEHYNSRRFGHLLKLSMIASIDRSSDLMLDTLDFNKAMGWLVEAESQMPNVFRSGSTPTDSQSIDEIIHFVRTLGKVHEHKLVNFVRERIPAHSVMRVLDVMEKSGLIKVVEIDKLGIRIFTSSPSQPSRSQLQ